VTDNLPIPAVPLAPAERRAEAAAVLGAAAGLDPPAAGLLVTVLDLASSAILSAGGVRTGDAALVLAELWTPERG